MPWRIDSTSGPMPGPWEGKDVVSWIWEIYRGENARRILVEVSGTAMAVDEDFLPPETAAARATSGRSEIEKVLDHDDPPRRISLGTTGYLSWLPNLARPDFLIKGPNGRTAAAVDVKNPEHLTTPVAVETRDRYAPAALTADGLRFVLVLSQNVGFLFDLHLNDPRPTAEFEMFDTVQRYYPHASREQRFRSADLQILVEQWLRDLVTRESVDTDAERSLFRAGFLDAVKGGQLEVQRA